MSSQAASFATVRPSHWSRLAAQASRDLYAYLLFVRQLRPAPHHEVIIERLLWGGPLELILGPPGSGKSTIAVAYLEWTLGRDNDLRWLICSEVEHGVASDHLRTIADTVANNERYIMTFGQLKGSPWNDHNLYLCKRTPKTAPPPFPWLGRRGRRPGLTNPNVRVVSWESLPAGVRCDSILCDDYVSDKSSYSELVTKRAFEALTGKVMARRSQHPQEQVIYLGQRWSPRDLPGLILGTNNTFVAYDSNPGREGLQVLEPTP
jgi:hypothetical protein